MTVNHTVNLPTCTVNSRVPQPTGHCFNVRGFYTMAAINLCQQQQAPNNRLQLDGWMTAFSSWHGRCMSISKNKKALLHLLKKVNLCCPLLDDTEMLYASSLCTSVLWLDCNVSQRKTIPSVIKDQKNKWLSFQHVFLQQFLNTAVCLSPTYEVILLVD